MAPLSPNDYADLSRDVGVLLRKHTWNEADRAVVRRRLEAVRDVSAEHWGEHQLACIGLRLLDGVPGASWRATSVWEKYRERGSQP